MRANFKHSGASNSNEFKPFQMNSKHSKHFLKKIIFNHGTYPGNGQPAGIRLRQGYGATGDDVEGITASCLHGGKAAVSLRGSQQSRSTP
jgi:hypothetical protein